ncbi:MAG: hypothetical protein WCP29_02840 [Acidobacteriota bacterium]
MPQASHHARVAAQEFLKIAGDFSLGELVTEAAHPRSIDLSHTAKTSAASGLATLFDIDRDVIAKYDVWSQSAQPAQLADACADALRRGRRLFFTGCGATGRLSIQLDAIWRRFWQRRREEGRSEPSPDRWEGRTCSVMAGGDFALIKSVEGFEDFAPFGRQQIRDQGLAAGDVVFAITEGGETSFVIGTAWQGLESGARVFFVYNNPDDVLRAHVVRSRDVIDEPRIEKVNLTTGPMAITGSTRMQATSIQLLAMLTVLEMTTRMMLADAGVSDARVGPAAAVPAEVRRDVALVHAELASERILDPLARLVEAEEAIYRGGRRTSYFAAELAVDVLTDTTERSPTYCTPSFRKWDDATAVESWAFLFVPEATTDAAWRRVLSRQTQTIAWTADQLREWLDENAAVQQQHVLDAIGRSELMRFRIGLDGLAYRPFRPGDGAIAVASGADLALALTASGGLAVALAGARSAGALTALVGVGPSAMLERLTGSVACAQADVAVFLRVPDTAYLLDPISRVGAKMLLNALSTCTMVRLGRVLGNRMIWVVPSNLKLIDRSTRYIRDLAGVSYETACLALFEVIEYIEPRRRAGQAYPAPVGVAVMRLRHGLDLPDAEHRLIEELT